MSATPRVWIGCLASYNAGRLIGEWCDATDVNEMNECQLRVAAQAVTAAKEAKEYPVYFGDPEEFFIADYDGFGALASTLGEYAPYEQVARVGTLIEEHGEAFIAFIDTCEVDLDELGDDTFEAHYRGEWGNEEAFARNLVEELGWAGVPARLDSVSVFEELSSYLDWESIARELFRHGNYASAPAGAGNVYVFEREV